jgi:hypothetical protein
MKEVEKIFKQVFPSDVITVTMGFQDTQHPCFTTTIYLELKVMRISSLKYPMLMLEDRSNFDESTDFVELHNTIRTRVEAEMIALKTKNEARLRVRIFLSFFDEN